MLKIALVALIAVYYTSDRLVDSACSFTFTNTVGLTFDPIRCKVYVNNVNCSLNFQDPFACLNLDCPLGGSSNTTITSMCPYKCNCLEPTILNNYSPPCYNGGTLFVGATNNTYSCSCPYPYLGTQCQNVNISNIVSDPGTCSNVDCYNSNLYDLFRCQAKCFPCDNQTCFNGGYVFWDPSVGDCACSCPSGGSYNTTDCSLIAGTCADSLFCIGIKTFMPEAIDCTQSYYQGQCPFSCRVCQTTG
jgi:hypothetical protein